jgi:hypothetical protein
MSVRFTSGTTIDIQNPVRGNIYERQLQYATGRTAAGSFYAYSKGVALKRMGLRFENLRNVEKAALEGFFATTVGGPGATFTYTDHDGTSWTARFLEDVLRFEETHDEKNSTTTFTLSAVTYPTTTRKNPVWNVEFELEVS